MRITDQIRFGPFSSAYHRGLVDDAFKATLQQFLERELLPQLDELIRDAEGSLVATFDSDRYCGPNSLVRDVFTLELVLVGDTGTSELKSDIVFNAIDRSFCPRTGHGHRFYVWTPLRRKTHEHEMESIQRVIEIIQRCDETDPECPICAGSVSAINNSDIFEVRCTVNRCFQYNYHKDKNGRLVHGHFFTKHPEERTE
ncbi:hypothetical protein RMSM_01201 [Rhodopirellula maiorica SM1]|uniref:Uncharacterized protein n=1 Tax=Rhodopirellula maiorica SM1 TaxID=1265738 RepID=M5S2L7_9BACT|nr:hypothetical protein [Rhodopirellula maiorica]EMI21872.1 hypothetical protein RMSM_01201 [Rhodopirellula maiorica SM1]